MIIARHVSLHMHSVAYFQGSRVSTSFSSVVLRADTLVFSSGPLQGWRVSKDLSYHHLPPIMCRVGRTQPKNSYLGCEHLHQLYQMRTSLFLFISSFLSFHVTFHKPT